MRFARRGARVGLFADGLCVMTRVHPIPASACAAPRGRRAAAALAWAALTSIAAAQTPQVLDIPTRPGVTNRLLVLAPGKPRAVALLYAGGHGGLQLSPEGAFGWGEGNFVVRTRQLFAEQALVAVVVDAPSDRQQPPHLNRFRQTAEHAQDAAAIIAEMRRRYGLPVWLVGTSRGTQSVAAIATALPEPPAGPDGIVLTSSILTDPAGRPLPAMPLQTLRLPALVVHHEQDGCAHCRYADLPLLTDRLQMPRKQVLTFTGGRSVGDPCEARAFHGFNGLESQVVSAIARWMLGG